LLLDVNETLSDMAPLAARFQEIGVPGDRLTTWFASTLRDGIALTAAGGYAEFLAVARSALAPVLAAEREVRASLPDAIEFVLAGLSELPLHADVAPGLEVLHSGGVRLFALTNGPRTTTEALLDRGGVAAFVEQVLSVEEVRRWKPAVEPYRLAVARAGVRPHEAMLVAVHPWDVDGAKRAGISAAWVRRHEVPYPAVMREPDLVAENFVALAEQLLSR
jgi:2-haloacid dehalogenase